MPYEEPLIDLVQPAYLLFIQVGGTAIVGSVKIDNSLIPGDSMPLEIFQEFVDVLSAAYPEVRADVVGRATVLCTPTLPTPPPESEPE